MPSLNHSTVGLDRLRWFKMILIMKTLRLRVNQFTECMHDIHDWPDHAVSFTPKTMHIVKRTDHFCFTSCYCVAHCAYHANFFILKSALDDFFYWLHVAYIESSIFRPLCTVSFRTEFLSIYYTLHWNKWYDSIIKILNKSPKFSFFWTGQAGGEIYE